VFLTAHSDGQANKARRALHHHARLEPYATFCAVSNACWTDSGPGCIVSGDCMSAKRQPTFKHPMRLLALGVATGLMLLWMSYEMKKTEGVILGREGSGRGGVVSTASGMPTPDAPRRSATRGGVEEVHPTQRKLQSIILPKVAFEDTTFEEAIEFLRQRTVEELGEGADGRFPPLGFLPPQGQASFVPEEMEALVERIANSRIRFHAENISVWDVMKEVARQAKVEISFKEDGPESNSD
jgi:hypothetical protein